MQRPRPVVVRLVGVAVPVHRRLAAVHRRAEVHAERLAAERCAAPGIAQRAAVGHGEAVRAWGRGGGACKEFSYYYSEL